MRRRWHIARIVVLVVLASCGATTSPPDLSACDGSASFAAGTWRGSAVDVPITMQAGTRFTVPIVIGGVELDAALDTATAGLRVIARDVVPDTAFTCITTTADTLFFHDGSELDGWVARANVAIGGVATPAPIPVSYLDGDPALLGGLHAVLGVAMHEEVGMLGSPIAQLPGQPSFVIHAPGSDGTPGTLTIGPDDTTGFATTQVARLNMPPLANGTPPWVDLVPACIDLGKVGEDYCEPAAFASATGITYIESPAVMGSGLLPSGIQVSVTIGSMDAPLASYERTLGSQDVDEIELESAGAAGFIELGEDLFFRDDALFDPLHGVVGLRRR